MIAGSIASPFECIKHRQMLSTVSRLDHLYIEISQMSRFMLARTGQFRSLSTTSFLLRHIQYDFQKIQSLVSNATDSTKLIDVREPHEFEAGAIPKAINLPLSQLQESLTQLSASDFSKKYGTEKPGKNDRVVFYCRSGVRSTKAAEIAESSGLAEVGNYKGSFLDWESQNKDSTASSNGIKNPDLESGKGDGAEGGIDLKAMNQKEEARAQSQSQSTKDKEANSSLAGRKVEESESVKSGAEMGGGKKLQ